MFILNFLQIKFSNTKESVVFPDYNKFRKRKVQLPNDEYGNQNYIRIYPLFSVYAGRYGTDFFVFERFVSRSITIGTRTGTARRLFSSCLFAKGDR